MKKTKNPKPSLSKGRVTNLFLLDQAISEDHDAVPCAVLPFSSRKKARAFVRAVNTLGPEHALALLQYKYDRKNQPRHSQCL